MYSTVTSALGRAGTNSTWRCQHERDLAPSDLSAKLYVSKLLLVMIVLRGAASGTTSLQIFICCDATRGHFQKSDTLIHTYTLAVVWNLSSVYFGLEAGLRNFSVQGDAWWESKEKKAFLSCNLDRNKHVTWEAKDLAYAWYYMYTTEAQVDWWGGGGEALSCNANIFPSPHLLACQTLERGCPKTSLG